MNNNIKLERAYKFCFLLKDDILKQELEEQLNGYKLKSIEYKDNKFECYFISDNEENISLYISRSLVYLVKRSNNIVSNITITEDKILRQEVLEKHDSGILLIDIKKYFAPSFRFKDKTVLVDLYEDRYIFTKDNLNKNINEFDYDNISPMQILIRLKKDFMMSGFNNICDFHNTFSTHMNYYINWAGRRKMTDNPYSNKTYINKKEVSRFYDIVEGDDKLYRIYDLYRGIINDRNINDIISINLGLLSQEAYDLKTLIGITEKENKMIKKLNIENQESYLIYLKEVLYKNLDYKDEIKLDRQSLINIILYDELEDKVSNERLYDYNIMDQNKIVKSDESIINKTKKILKRILKCN